MVKWVAPPWQLPKAPPPHNLEGVKAALPNTQKQTQGGCQIEDPKRTTPRHIIIKMQKVKDKEKILKAAREKQRVTYKGVPIRLSADFSKQLLQARRD